MEREREYAAFSANRRITLIDTEYASSFQFPKANSFYLAQLPDQHPAKKAEQVHRNKKSSSIKSRSKSVFPSMPGRHPKQKKKERMKQKETFCVRTKAAHDHRGRLRRRRQRQWQPDWQRPINEPIQTTIKWSWLVCVANWIIMILDLKSWSHSWSFTYLYMHTHSQSVLVGSDWKSRRDNLIIIISSSISIPLPIMMVLMDDGFIVVERTQLLLSTTTTMVELEARKTQKHR